MNLESKTLYLRTFLICTICMLFMNLNMVIQEQKTQENNTARISTCKRLPILGLDTGFQWLAIVNIEEPPEHRNIITVEHVAGFNEDWLSKENLEKLSQDEIQSLSIQDNMSEFSQKDIDLMARVTMSEASTQSYEVQVAVAQTIVNRLHSGLFGDSLQDIIYTKHQYSTLDNGDPTEGVYAAVLEAINNPKHPKDMYYFRTRHYHKFAKDYTKMGVFYFSTHK